MNGQRLFARFLWWLTGVVNYGTAHLVLKAGLGRGAAWLFIGFGVLCMLVALAEVPAKRDGEEAA